jgi:hypothetical protein
MWLRRRYKLTYFRPSLKHSSYEWQWSIQGAVMSWERGINRTSVHPRLGETLTTISADRRLMYATATGVGWLVAWREAAIELNEWWTGSQLTWTSTRPSSQWSIHVRVTAAGCNYMHDSIATGCDRSEQEAGCLAVKFTEMYFTYPEYSGIFLSCFNCYSFVWVFERICSCGDIY